MGRVWSIGRSIGTPPLSINGCRSGGAGFQCDPQWIVLVLCGDRSRWSSMGGLITAHGQWEI